MEMTREEAIRKYINDLNSDDLILLVYHINSYAEVPDEWNFSSMDEFDEAMDVYTPTEIVYMAWQTDFDPTQDYFQFDGLGNIYSFDKSEIEEKLEEYKDDIVDYIVNVYSGDTPWRDLDIIVDADDNAMFTENYEQVYE